MDYFKVDALGRSDLRAIVNNVEEWYWRKVGILPPVQQTKDMVFGSALDFFLCNGKGPDPIPENTVMVPDDVLASNGARSTKAYREWLAELPAGTPTLTTREAEKLRAESEEQMQAFIQCEAQLRAHSEAAALMFDEDALHQHAMVIPDPETGEALKTMPDIVIPGVGIVDLKTSCEVGTSSFLRHCDRFWYDAQAAIGQYAWSYENDEILPVYFVVVRNKPPYDCVVYKAGDWMTGDGWDRVRFGIEKYQRCMERGEWRNESHGQVIEINEPPRWWSYRNELQIESEVE